MTVAILMPTHRGHADAAYRSCWAQTDDRWEAFVLDDGGHIETWFASTAPIKYRRREKHPANEPGVRNEMFRWWEESGYPFACWLDSDDSMYPERIRAQREYLEAHQDVDIVFSDMAVVQSRHTPGGIFDGGQAEEVTEIRSVDPRRFGKSLEDYRTLVSPTAMFRPSVRAVPFDENMRHGGCDKLWLFTLVQQGFKIGTVRQPLYYLREHPGRLTRVRETLPREVIQKELDYFYAEIARMGGTR